MGARQDVWPSVMSRGMGDGTTALIHRMGESPDAEQEGAYLFETLGGEERGVTPKGCGIFEGETRNRLPGTQNPTSGY
jgi:hypothetical protein